ncbi:membrane protein DedA, SNARE-associated domain [Fodinibius salinus]|uniref:Membrane protein DedA, SNARE-associated domain n=1 Tax=Fodinibius salinus TaxID=860790 RepID=A0A5D3YN46_9BACT|nr:DedA family protein [Fodinibius salinus]TYP94131.1 membrane protein DedA, SNARE-associated domain [Fodinibius salinus]
MAEQFIQEFVELVNSLPPLSIYLVFFLVAYFENIIPPIPGDVLVAFGGYLAAESVIGFVTLLIVTTIASVIGFMSMYWIGSRWGTQIKNGNKRIFLLRFIPIEYLEKTRSWMQNWGLGVVLANRFLPGTRSVISLTAGLSHTRILATVICSTISSILWNGILLGLGWIVHENWRQIGKYLSVYGQIILAALALFVLIRIGIYLYRE